MTRKCVHLFICAVLISHAVADDDCYECTSNIQTSMEDFGAMVKKREPVHYDYSKDVSCLFAGLSTLSHEDDACPVKAGDNMIATILKPVVKLFKIKCNNTMRINPILWQKSLIDILTNPTGLSAAPNKKDDEDKLENKVTLANLMSFKSCTEIKMPPPEPPKISFGGVEPPQEIVLSGIMGANWPNVILDMTMEGKQAQRGAKMKKLTVRTSNMDTLTSVCEGDPLFVSLCKCLIEAGMLRDLYLKGFKEELPLMFQKIFEEFSTIADTFSCSNIEGMRRK